MSKEFQIRDGNLIASFDLENEDGDIDFCKLLKVSHGVADEIGMFVDYVATNKIIKDQSKQIADLEAKLATQENTITNLIEDNRASQEWYKKQLEEKEKENELMTKTLRMTKCIEKEINQDKISFALDQLEKVKEFVKENESWEIEGSDYSIVYADDVLVRIDNQIEELKKEMK